MDGKDFIGQKIDDQADLLFKYAKKEVRVKIEECVRLLGDYIDQRSSTYRLCGDLMDILKAESIKDIQNPTIQKFFYRQAWNKIQEAYSH